MDAWNSQAKKQGVGAFTDKPFVCITNIHYRVIKKGGWALTLRWVLTRDTMVTHFAIVQS